MQVVVRKTKSPLHNTQEETLNTMPKEKEQFVIQRESDRSIVFWRGLIVWSLGTFFIFMLALLILFLILLSRSPLTEEDLQICRESEFNEDSDVIQLTQLNYDTLTSQKDTSWLIELYVPTV